MDSRVELDATQMSKELAVIEYPGDVQNIDNMIKTLGGSTEVSQVLGGEQKRFEIKFQPENEFCKPLSSSTDSNAGLLLRIKVRRSKRKPHAPTYSHVEVLGHCKKVHTFQDLADYQFLPLQKNKETGECSYIREKVLPTSVEDIDYFSRTNVPFLCIPYQFAKSDTVHHNMHRIDPKDNGQAETLGVLTKPIYDTREVVAFSLTEPLPTNPDRAVAKRMRIKYVSDEQLKEVKTLFDKIPCWTRFGLLYESKVSADKLKHILPSIAYCFNTGPWRSMYVRYGYDPRKDFNSRYDQTFDLRVRFRSGMSEFVSAVSTVRTSSKTQDQEQSTCDADFLIQDQDYPYLEEGKLPRSRQWILRYRDLRLTKIKEMLDKIPTPLAGAICNEKTGWLPPGFDAQVRQIINNSFKETITEYYKKKKMQGNTVEDEEYISDDNEPDKDSDEYDEAPEEDIDVEMDSVKLEGTQMGEDEDM